MGQSADQVSRLGRLDAVTSEADAPAVIEAEIAQTRAGMSATVEAIQQRLNPEQAKDSARELAEEVLQEAKDHARELVQEASEHAREVLKDATAHVQGAIHDATIGRVQHMVTSAQYRANEASDGLMTTIRQNPVPAALAGIGLAWLWMNRRSTGGSRMANAHEAAYAVGPARGGYDGGMGYRYGPGYGTGARPAAENGMAARVGQTVGGAASQAGEAASGLASQVGDTVGGIAGQVGETAGQVANQVGTSAANLAGTVGDSASGLLDATQERAGQLAEMVGDTASTVEDRFQRTMRTNPLAVGAVALAVGTAIGLALPQTQRENHLLGEARDTLVEKVQGSAQEAVEKVQAVAGEAQQTAKAEAHKQGLTS